MIESIYLTLQGTFLQNIFKIIMITTPIYLIILAFKFFSKSKKINIYRCLGEFIFLGYIVTVLLLIGFLFTMLYAKGKRKVLRTIIVAMLFSISIEALEYLVGRYVDIDDILWNAIGAWIGTGVYILISNTIAKHNKNKNGN